MGGSASSNVVAHIAAEKRSEDEIVRFVMPLFYTKIPITPEEKAAADHAWKMILNNHCQYFFETKAQHPEIEHKLVQEYFYDVFYNRLFDVHPSCRVLFQKSINKQGSFLLRMISMLLQEIEEPEKFKKTLANLTHIHNKMGVKAVEYSIMGEVLLYTIKKCLGPKEYSQIVHFGWAKVYSRMLDCIVPLVVKFELENRELADQIQMKRNNQQNDPNRPLFTVRGEGATIAHEGAATTRTAELVDKK